MARPVQYLYLDELVIAAQLQLDGMVHMQYMPSDCHALHVHQAISLQHRFPA